MVPRLLLLALLLAPLAGCRSAERMVRISPFSEEATRDRVNLWPLAYHDRSATSVLWPIFDVDADGFALRPLLAKEKDDWSLLFPLAGWDAADREGWFGPLYSVADNRGLFPLVNIGDPSWVTLAWWYRGDGGGLESGGLFPVVLFAELGWFGPAWWNTKSDAYGLFPLFGVGDLSHVGPFWWERKPDGELGGGVFPLVWFDTASDTVGVLPFYAAERAPGVERRWYLMGLGHSSVSDERTLRWVLPVYFRDSRPERSDVVVLPLFWKTTRGESSRVFTLLGDRAVGPDASSFNLYPLWWSEEDEDSAWRMLLPLFYYEREADRRTLLTMLGGRGWSTTGETRFVNVLGPLFHKSESADGREARTAFLWPLFETARDGDERTTRALPFYSGVSTPEATERWYGLGLGHALEEGGSSGARLWPLFSSHDFANEPDLLYDFTLYGKHEHGAREKEWLFPLWSREVDGDRRGWRALLGLVDHRREGDDRAWRAWPLVSWTEGERDPDPLYALTLFGRSRWETGRRFHAFTPLVWVTDEHRDATERNSHTRLLTFFVGEAHEDTGLHLPRGRSLEHQNRVERDSLGFFFDLFVSRTERYRVWEEGLLSDEQAAVLHRFSDRYADDRGLPREPETARAILTELDHAPADDSEPALREALGRLAAERTEEVERREVRLPLLWNYEREAERTEWSGPLWAVQSESGPEREAFSLLWYGYRSETVGTRTRRDVFPFVTWDTDEGEDEVEVSFLWRLFRYRRVGEERGGHVLFIPWGDV